MNSNIKLNPKKLLIQLTIVVYLIILIFPQALASPINPHSIEGETCVLMDVKTGKVLYEKDAHKQMEPASTTKIMTAIVALENGDLNDTVTIGSSPPLLEGSKINLKKGEKLTLEQMLYGMLLNSGNDAALAIAEHIGKSSSNFVKMMNKKTKEIGAKETNFVNPTGLPDENHLTTAYDLALISRYAILNLPKFREITSTKNLEMHSTNMSGNRKLENTNELLRKYEGADGIKTGYTSAAGRTLVASATKDGWQLLAVVLKSNWFDIWPDATSLLDYGFNNFQKVEVKEGELISTEKVRFGKSDVEITTSKDFYEILPKSSKDLAVTKKININKKLKAPIKKGAILGTLEIYQGDKNIGSVDLIAKERVKVKAGIVLLFWLIIIGSISYLLIRYPQFLLDSCLGDFLSRYWKQKHK